MSVGTLGWRSRATIAVLSVAASIGATALAVPVQAQSAPVGPVSTKPASGTPQLAPSGSVEQVRQLVQCGATMYAVGSFTEIKQGTTTYRVNNVFSFSATSPYTLTKWFPNVNGKVNTIAFSGGNCADAYIGGKFTSVGGTPVSDIAEISTTTGAVVPGFKAIIGGQVQTIAGYGNHLLVGGQFKSINGSSTDPYMASLNPVTGQDDGFLHLKISGNYQYPGAGPNQTDVYNQQLSHGGTLDLVEGDFTSVGGLGRQQMFMLNLSGSTATVTGWSSPEFDGSKGNLPGGYAYQCYAKEPFYIRTASWSPDDSTIYIGTTGYHPWNSPTAGARAGLCDAAAAFPATQTEVKHLWINYTGCDSLYSTVADTSTAYFGGHERWSSNPDGCNNAGPGAIPAPGMEGLSPANGTLTYNPTRGRGLGADDMVITGGGLWIASDNDKNTAMCGGQGNHAGICFFPYPST
jgi:hypothetical protein